MKEEKKVYCPNCKHSLFWEAGWGSCGYECKLTAKEGHNHMCKYNTYTGCEEINENADCKDYERKWWKFWC